ncbi:MAG: hypothetical protein GF410_18070 [Chitinivibrionales bacterium]|nr:hypothetical protein [Chitinivibrionales bacterium]
MREVCPETLVFPRVSEADSDREVNMMFQPIDEKRAWAAITDGRPDRTTVIQNDEIVNLKIDLETIALEELYEKHFEN